MSGADHSITQLLKAGQTGSRAALDELFRRVEAELRRTAEAQMQRERAGHTLQPSVLVHDAFLKLVGNTGDHEWNNRKHFYRAAARAMRFILVDYERRRRTIRRGGGKYVRLDVDLDQIGMEQTGIDLLALDEALERLARIDGRQAEIVDLHHFGGLTLDETAQVVGVSRSTIKGEWAAARAWLHRELTRE